jgi:hypothetical protein
MARELVQALQMLSDLAAPFDVRIAIRSHTPSVGDSSTALTQVQQLTGLVNRQQVGIALEIGQVHNGDSGLQELANLSCSKLWIVDLGIVNDNARSIGLTEAVCHHLAEKEFQGPYSLELVCQTGQCEQAAQAAWHTAQKILQT